ncbi:MAG: 3-deoxy-D-manno-octulosonate 8-phosphate phosphatase, partial [Bacteroidaceae bacterium]|nr:3-deoxy-D-manno-octulosonate 8-phosphate phosphatase [Bacteroidaceae bacterium]
MINYDLKKIKAIIFDVDGVLSAATIQIGNDGQPIRTANIKDGYAMQLAVRQGLRLAIITGGKVESVRTRYEGLGMTDVFLGCSMKIETYEALCT